MKLKTLYLKNYLSYAEQEIDLDKLGGVIFLIGSIDADNSRSNGSGKSAIFDAIEWALFGVSRTNSDDGLIRTGQREMGVGLTFALDGVSYCIYRTKKFGKSQTLAFTREPSSPLTGNAVRETQEKIIEVLGIDSELYENTVYVKQGCIDLFPKQTPAKRKEMLRDILKIGQYEKWENDAKEMAKTYEAQYLNLKGTMEQIQAIVESITVTEIDLAQKTGLVVQSQDKIKKLETDIEIFTKSYNQMKTAKLLLDKELENSGRLSDDVKRITVQLEYINGNAQKEIDKIMADKKKDVDVVEDEVRIRSVLEEINKSIAAEDTSRLQYEAMSREDELLANEIRRLSGMTAEYDTEVNKLRNKLIAFRELKDKCPTCLSTINEEQKKRVEAEIIEEGKSKKVYQEKLAEELDAAKSKSAKIKLQLKSVNYGLGKSRELEQDKSRYERDLINIETAKNRIEYTETKISETKNMFMKQKLELGFELKRKQEAYAQSIKAAESYKADFSDMEKLEVEILGMEDIKRTLVAEEKKLTEELHKIKYDLDLSKKKREEFALTNMKLEKAQQDYFVYSELVRAFGKNGIPLLVVENALAELQDEVAKQLDVLTDGAITVEFRTQKELKSGKTSDSLDILVGDKFGIRDFGLYSGGERMRVALAIRLGLAKLLSRRAGKKFSLLIVDEISDLDFHGMSKFVDLINLVSKNFEQIFVVSHISELKDRFDQVIEVRKTATGSRVYA